jgi:hypothetical protein
MKIRSALTHRFVRLFPLLLLVISLIEPGGVSLSAQTTEVIVEQPLLFPSTTNCEADAWYTIPSNVGGNAYLTLNVSNPAESTNHGEWHPLIPQVGFNLVHKRQYKGT